MDDVLQAVRRSRGAITDFEEAGDDDARYAAAERLADLIDDLREVGPGEGLIGLLDLPRDDFTDPLLDDVMATLAEQGPAVVEALLRVVAGCPLSDDDFDWGGWRSAPHAAAATLAAMNESDLVLGLAEVFSGESDEALKWEAVHLLAAIGAAAVDDLQEEPRDHEAQVWVARVLDEIARRPDSEPEAPCDEPDPEEAAATEEFAETKESGRPVDLIGSPSEDDAQPPDPEVERLLPLFAVGRTRETREAFQALTDDLVARGPGVVGTLLEVGYRGDATVRQSARHVFDAMPADVLFAGLMAVLLTDAARARRSGALDELEHMGPEALDKLEALRDDPNLGLLAGLCLAALPEASADCVVDESAGGEEGAGTGDGTEPGDPDEDDEWWPQAAGVPTSADPAAIAAIVDAYLEAQIDDDAQYALDELEAAVRARGGRLGAAAGEFRRLVDELVDIYFVEETPDDPAWAVAALTALVDACGHAVGAFVLDATDQVADIDDIADLRDHVAGVIAAAAQADAAGGDEARRREAVERIVAGEGMLAD